jgi:hypothetical protein
VCGSGAHGSAQAHSCLNLQVNDPDHIFERRTGGTTLQVAQFYVPAIGAMALLATWLVVRIPRRVLVSAVASVALVVATFGLGAWSFNRMRETTPSAAGPVSSGHGPAPGPGGKVTATRRSRRERAGGSQQVPGR